jgi:hypothetical protein
MPNDLAFFFFQRLFFDYLKMDRHLTKNKQMIDTEKTFSKQTAERRQINFKSAADKLINKRQTDYKPKSG